MSYVQHTIVIENAFIKETEEYLQAAANGDNEKILSILKTGNVDIDQANKEGMTALMHAASNGHLDTVRLLLEKEADPCIQTTEIGNTALFYAVKV